MEKARQQLETDALIRRYNEGQDPMTPTQEPDSDDGVKTHVIPIPQPKPDEVIDEEGLGAKD